MSFPKWELFTGARAVLVYTFGNRTDIFGHGQRLRDLTITRNYAPIYTIGSREVTAIPRGQFRVSWGVDAALSNPEILCLVFACTQTQSGTTGTTLQSPVFFTVDGWLQSGNVVRNIRLTNATVTELSLSVESGRPEVSISLTGIARDAILSDTGTPPTITFPTRIYTFADAVLLGANNQEIPVTRAEITIRQGAEPVYAIGDDRFGALYLGEYEVELSVSIPTSVASVEYLRQLLNNACVTGFTLRLRSCSDAMCVSQPVTRVSIVLTGVGRITEFRSPITEIGMNETTITFRISRALLEIVTESQ